MISGGALMPVQQRLEVSLIVACNRTRQGEVFQALLRHWQAHQRHRLAVTGRLSSATGSLPWENRCLRSHASGPVVIAVFRGSAAS